MKKNIYLMTLIVCFFNGYVCANTQTDMTHAVKNPNYSEGKTAWKDTNSDWVTKEQMAEHYDDIFNHYQEIVEIPNGLYKLTVQGFIKQADYVYKGNDDYRKMAVIYAINGNDSITKPVHDIYDGATNEPLSSTQKHWESEKGYIPATMETAATYFKAGKYLTECHINVTDGNLRIGITLPEQNGNEWVAWSNWKLTYYGTDTDDYAKNFIKKLVEEELNRFDTISSFVTIGTVETYKQVLNNMLTEGISDIHQAETVVYNAIDTVKANIKAWEEFKDLAEDIETLLAGENVYWNDNLRELDDYMKGDVKKQMESLTLTTQELLKQTEKLEQWHRENIYYPVLYRKVWSYVTFERMTRQESGEMEEKNSYTRYTLLPSWTNIGRMSYRKLVKHTTCKYEEGQETKTYRLRFEKDRIYILKEDAPDYAGSGIILKEEGNDYLLYDFSLDVGEELYKYVMDGTDTVSVTVSEISEIDAGNTFKIQRLNVGKGWLIDGLGSTQSLLYHFFPEAMTCDCGASLNCVYREYITGNQMEYKNPFGNITAVSTAFKEDDCALAPDAIEKLVKEKQHSHVQLMGSSLLCLSPTATLLEVYTMDAVKVGEASFLNGKASVAVDKVPSTYLYIVTYPDGQRESGKVMVK